MTAHHEFLFCFGYETPGQTRANDSHGWDDENTQAVFIKASSMEEAISWGFEIAERFVDELYRAAHRSFSWKAGEYAWWIETDPEVIARARGSCAHVVAGEFPSLA